METHPSSARESGALARVLDGIAWLCLSVAGVQLVTLIVIFGWLVYGRYVLNDTPTWVEQLSLLLVVWITFLGAAAGVWYKSHLSVDFIRERLPVPIQKPLEILSILGMIAFGGLLAWHGKTLAATTWPRIIPMLGVNEGWRAVPMSLCGGLTVVFSLFHLAQALTSDKKAL